MEQHAVGLVVFSFALRDESMEPNPANTALANETLAAVDRLRERTLVVAQWEVARALESNGHNVDYIVHPREDGQYLDSVSVWEEALHVFESHGIQRVLPVAKPGLHLWRVQNLVRQSGLTLIRTRFGRVPYDPSPLNHQWWTRGPLRLFAYSTRQAATALTARSRGGRWGSRSSTSEFVDRRDVRAHLDISPQEPRSRTDPTDSNQDTPATIDMPIVGRSHPVIVVNRDDWIASEYDPSAQRTEQIA